MVDVDPDPVFIHDGDVWTSAGITAGIDLSLALVEDELGPAVALARALVVFVKRPGGQSQSAERSRPNNQRDQRSESSKPGSLPIWRKISQSPGSLIAH